jgi:hypothetical protein
MLRMVFNRKVCGSQRTWLERSSLHRKHQWVGDALLASSLLSSGETRRLTQRACLDVDNSRSSLPSSVRCLISTSVISTH